MQCKICETRKPRRYCPGVQGDICSICCGREREVTIACPLECPYLKEAHSHEKPVELDRKNVPNADIEISDGFLRRHEDLMMFLGMALRATVASSTGVVDSDVREALESLTRTYRTLSNGLLYESLPVNPYAATIHTKLQQAVTDFRAELKKREMNIRDAELLGILVMYQRLSMTYNNGRPKGRWFIDFLIQQFPLKPQEAEEQPSAPLIEL